jgi:acylphosphatase
MIARHLLVRGTVQGVFFRAWTERNAQALGLSGWVRNRRSGDVEIFVQGPARKVEELIRRCHEGPSRAVVTDVSIEEAEALELEGFGKAPTA